MYYEVIALLGKDSTKDLTSKATQLATKYVPYMHVYIT